MEEASGEHARHVLFRGGRGRGQCLGEASSLPWFLPVLLPRWEWCQCVVLGAVSKCLSKEDSLYKNSNTPAAIISRSQLPQRILFQWAEWCSVRGVACCERALLPVARDSQWDLRSKSRSDSLHHFWNIFVCVSVVEASPAVLSLGMFCETDGLL